MPTTGERFERAVQIMARLRAPGGCPWDREQSFDSIKPYTLEEAYEVLEAIDNRDWDELTGELGDLLLQVLFYAEMAKEEERFGIDEVLDTLSNKLVNRHPHVFGDVEAKTSADVLRNWEAIKAEEKRKKLEERENSLTTPLKPKQGLNGAPEKEPGGPESVLAGVSRGVPALMEAFKLSSRAAHVGFEWPEIGQLFDKLEEETLELKKELEQLPDPNLKPPLRGVASSGKQQIPEELRARMEDEVGDLLFVMVNVARYLSLDPESALRKTNRKFRNRFQWVEQRLHEQGKKPSESTLDEMETLWQKSKQQERR
jgi:MazG family protein